LAGIVPIENRIQPGYTSLKPNIFKQKIIRVNLQHRHFFKENQQKCVNKIVPMRDYEKLGAKKN